MKTFLTLNILSNAIFQLSFENFMYAHTLCAICFDYIYHHFFTVSPQSTINPFQLHVFSLRQILIWTAHILMGVCPSTGAWITWQGPQS